MASDPKEPPGIRLARSCASCKYGHWVENWSSEWDGCTRYLWPEYRDVDEFEVCDDYKVRQSLNEED